MAVLKLPSPLAKAPTPVAVLELKLPLASAASPNAMFPPLVPLALAPEPQARLLVEPVAVAPPPFWGSLPSALPLQINCACAVIVPNKPKATIPAHGEILSRQNFFFSFSTESSWVFVRDPFQQLRSSRAACLLESKLAMEGACRIPVVFLESHDLWKHEGPCSVPVCLS
jgi:hypothetical protein